jgi:hypothetical protein
MACSGIALLYSYFEALYKVTRNLITTLDIQPGLELCLPTERSLEMRGARSEVVYAGSFLKVVKSIGLNK